MAPKHLLRVTMLASVMVVLAGPQVAQGQKRAVKKKANLERKVQRDAQKAREGTIKPGSIRDKSMQRRAAKSIGMTRRNGKVTGLKAEPGGGSKVTMTKRTLTGGKQVTTVINRTYRSGQPFNTATVRDKTNRSGQRKSQQVTAIYPNGSWNKTKKTRTATTERKTAKGSDGSKVTELTRFSNGEVNGKVKSYKRVVTRPDGTKTVHKSER